MNKIIKQRGELLLEKTACNKHKGSCPITCDVGILNAYFKSFIRADRLAVIEAVKEMCLENEQHQEPGNWVEWTNEARRFYLKGIRAERNRIRTLLASLSATIESGKN